jgi:hypothetical protein
MFHFSDLLNDTQGWQSPVEKRRALKGIEEMFRVGKGHIRSALPQVRSQRVSAGLAEWLKETDLCLFTVCIGA